MLKEFKEFAVKGNVMDLAVGVIIGGAFGKIVSSFVTDVLMPPLGLLTGGLDFSSIYINLSSQTYETLDAAVKAGAPVIKIGVFINAVVDFTIVAFAIFLMVRALNKLKKEAPAAAAAEPTAQEKLLTEIRDILRTK